jgi:hypothetical protein
MSVHPIIETWLFQSVLAFLVIGSMAAVVVGILLLFYPERFTSLSSFLNRWISTRKLDKSLESSFTLDPWMYRHRNLTGGGILLGAMFVLYYFTFQLDRVAAITGLSKYFNYPLGLVAGLLDALVLSALLGALCAIFVALSLLLRPSLLRGFEGNMNQWLSLRKVLKPMEIPRDDVERYVERHSRQVGIFLLLGGLYTLLVGLWWLVH